MRYTFISAVYADENHSSVVAFTSERGAVAISKIDRPEAWEALMASGAVIEPYARSPADDASAVLKDEWSKATTTAQKLDVLAKASGLCEEQS